MTRKQGYLLPAGFADLSQTVRVIGQDGRPVGMLTVMEATRMAEAEDAELVMIVPLAKPAACRIVSRLKRRRQP